MLGSDFDTTKSKWKASSILSVGTGEKYNYSQWLGFNGKKLAVYSALNLKRESLISENY